MSCPLTIEVNNPYGSIAIFTEFMQAAPGTSETNLFNHSSIFVGIESITQRFRQKILHGALLNKLKPEKTDEDDGMATEWDDFLIPMAHSV